MPDYTFELDSLTDLYNSGDYRLQEIIRSLREQSKSGSTIIAQRTFENVPTTELFRLQNINLFNDWILKTFPKRVFYEYVNVKRNSLDFVLVKSSEDIKKYSVYLMKDHNNNRLIVVGQGSNGFAVLTGAEHDVNNFSVQENFDDLEWSASFVVDPNQSYA